MQPGLTSLILITYNSAEVLPTFLSSLAETHPADYELIVVDNASSDETLAVLRGQANLTLIANPVNQGFGRACNQAARYASGDLLVFLNPDLRFTPAWLATLRSTLNQHPQIGLLGPATPYPDQPAPVVSAAQRLLTVAALPGSVLAIRRSTWEALGGFDPAIFLYWEDVDLCWRAWLAGWRVVRDQAAIVYHTRGGSGGGRGWDGEAMRAGIYVHLKLMRWRMSMPFLLRQALVACGKIALGRPGICAAWAWNLQQLGYTLAQRRAIQRTRQIDPAMLEAIAAQHVYVSRKQSPTIR